MLNIINIKGSHAIITSERFPNYRIECYEDGVLVEFRNNKIIFSSRYCNKGYAIKVAKRIFLLLT